MKMLLKTLACACAALVLAGCVPAQYERPAPWSVVGQATVAGFVFPESVGCDREENVLYVSQFGGNELKPAEKDGQGYISKIAPDGRILEARAFGDDKVVQVEPADFLDAGIQPKVSVAVAGKEIYPNGIWPGRGGTLLMAGFQSQDKPRGIHALAPNGETREVAAPLGRLDGLYELRDGPGLLVTDWNTGTLSRWNPATGLQPLASGFKGPADFCVLGTRIYVPDLVKGELRIVALAR